MTRPGIASIAAVGAMVYSGCAPEAPVRQGQVCADPEISAVLPDDIAESSGVAASPTHPGVYWTHNDSGWDAEVFAVDSTGAILGRVRVDGATNRDWEDIEAAPCAPGETDPCLFIGDIGDNNERHSRIGIYRIPEPNPWTDTVSARAVIFRATYPGGPRDAEALFVTDHGIHVVNKGRSHAIELFRLSPPYRAGVTVPFARIQQIGPPPTSVSAQVTGGAASPDQSRVVLRTYGGLLFFQLDGDTLVPHGRAAEIVAPEQRQGEGVDFVDVDRFILTTESQATHPASLAIVTCEP